MFNRVAQQDIVAPHNITGIMSRSRKRTPGGTRCCCKSQKKGKRWCNRKFRRKEHLLMDSHLYEKLPLKNFEVMESWDLGGDGKGYFKGSPSEEWFVKLMRK